MTLRSPCTGPGSCPPSVEQALSLDDLFARADAISVHVPLNNDTRGLVSAGAPEAHAQGRA